MKSKPERRKELMPVVEDRRAASNRRTDRRVHVELEVDYRASETFLFAYITDISAMGTLVHQEPQRRQPE